MGIDHIGISVPKNLFQKTIDFYEAALAPLGYKILLRPTETNVGFGRGPPDWWVGALDNDNATTPTHVAFSCASRASVDAFHKAALEAGAKDNGAPGERPIYHPYYYGAFVTDPAGNNIEAVCHMPPGVIGWIFGLFSRGS